MKATKTANVQERNEVKRQWKELPGNRYSPAELKRLRALKIVMERPPVRPVLEV